MQYINFSNYSNELNYILYDLKITNQYLEEQDKFLLSLISNDLLLEKNIKTNFLKRRNCIPSHA